MRGELDFENSLRISFNLILLYLKLKLHLSPMNLTSWIVSIVYKRRSLEIKEILKELH